MQIKCILDGLDDKNIDFPFKVSPPEREIINKCESDPSPVILVGRSGTGKTTCAVYRLLSNWLKARETPGNELNQVFVTASATLKDQVSRFIIYAHQIRNLALLSSKRPCDVFHRWRKHSESSKWLLCQKRKEKTRKLLPDL